MRIDGVKNVGIYRVQDEQTVPMMIRDEAHFHALVNPIPDVVKETR